MKKKSITVIRNAMIVGHNSKSYDEKHPKNPISLRPIHDAKKDCYTVNEKGERVIDHKKLAWLKYLSKCSKIDIERVLS